MKRAWLPVLVSAAVVLGVVSLLGGFGRAASATATQPHERRILFYQDSMHPWIKSEQAGKCTICGMDLTPIYEGEQGKDLAENLVALSSNAITVLNVQTEEVKRQPLTRTLRVAGTLEANETKKRVVAAPAAGRIDEIGVDYAGVEVREGQTLVTFYSPALTQDKLRFLVRTRHTGEQRDPTGNLAKELDASPYYSDLLAPQGGTVLERNVTKGQYVAEGEKLFTIADATVLWFRFDVYEQQLPWVRRGQKIQVTVPAVPGKTYTGVISFVEPMLNEATRTIKVRADIPNPVVETEGQKERLLRFGMYAVGVLQAETAPVVTVPGTAILYPGHSAYAYVAKGDGAYERRQVKLGREGNGSWEVLEGLDEGDRVVVAGNVLLDAQAQFNKGTADWMGGAQEMTAVSEVSEPASAASAGGGMMPAPPMLMPDPVAQTSASPTNTGSAGVPAGASRMPAQASPPPLARGKARTPTAQAPGAALASGNMMHLQLMDRWRERHAAELLENPPAKGAPAKLTDTQCQSLQSFLKVAGDIAQALAADDLAQFNRQIATLPNLVAGLEKQFARRDTWRGHVLHFSGAAQWPPAKDLDEARAKFLPFTANVVALASDLRKQEPAFGGLKIYHCPMAPKPGLWMQLEPPLRNPFYGSKMLGCGEEVAQK